MMSIFQVRDRRKERKRKEGKWKEIHLHCDEHFEFPLAKPKTTKENTGMGNDLNNPRPDGCLYCAVLYRTTSEI